MGVLFFLFRRFYTIQALMCQVRSMFANIASGYSLIGMKQPVSGCAVSFPVKRRLTNKLDYCYEKIGTSLFLANIIMILWRKGMAFRFWFQAN